MERPNRKAAWRSARLAAFGSSSASRGRCGGMPGLSMAYLPDSSTPACSTAPVCSGPPWLCSDIDLNPLLE
ncbi:hypothetical protein ACFFX0_04915 [Citricoccus parietis]|uniref:Uncharacterized protein n=1 Tax=Citricoccus parietis TaxID=592307 RepID=A0ABV5FV55_9MICC